ncbi:TRADD-N-associated membrane domain-containing protein [Streptomyces longwoodensis]|uniref:TRADD-N-associated membrane domain-containing protein n=1 Tax=Streptomyces longwoodensis TaxID=68231 RepID=UPI0033FD25F5
MATKAEGEEPPEESRHSFTPEDVETLLKASRAVSTNDMLESMRDLVAIAERVGEGQRVEQKVDRVDQIQNVFIGHTQGLQTGDANPQTNHFADQRQQFHFNFLNHTLKQAEWTFRLSVWFMTGGALIILAGGVLALVHAGNPDLSYLPLVTSLTGALITVGGGALALHSKRTMANLTKAAEDNEKKIDIDHKLEVATTLIDRVQDPQTKDRLHSAAALKALGMEAQPETMVNRLLPEEQPKQIEPGEPTR